MRSPLAQAETKSCILIIGANKLRQAGATHLSQAWADDGGLTICAIAPTTPLKKLQLTAKCGLVILSLGATSVEDPQQQEFIKSVHALVSGAPLVVLSDREEPQEVWAAFQAGAAGFMPTSIDPSVAFQALSFIKNGGTFFPPSALPHARSTPEKPSVTTYAGVNKSLKAYHRSHQLMGSSSKLSSKQKEVFMLLRQGESNKCMARRMGVSEATVKLHVRGIMHKLGLANRTQIAIAAIKYSPTFAAFITNFNWFTDPLPLGG